MDVLGLSLLAPMIVSERMLQRLHYRVEEMKKAKVAAELELAETLRIEQPDDVDKMYVVFLTEQAKILSKKVEMAMQTYERAKAHNIAGHG